MDQKKGFSLTEILVAVVIMSVLAGVAIPGFSKAKNKAAANQAINYLRTIRTSQKMYYSRFKNYLARADSAGIRSELGAETNNANGYSFNVTAPTPTTGFTATAVNTATGETITLNEKGEWSGTAAAYIPKTGNES